MVSTSESGAFSFTVISSEAEVADRSGLYEKKAHSLKHLYRQPLLADKVWFRLSTNKP
jgi:hypothetical protein